MAGLDATAIGESVSVNSAEEPADLNVGNSFEIDRSAEKNPSSPCLLEEDTSSQSRTSLDSRPSSSKDLIPPDAPVSQLIAN